MSASRPLPAGTSAPLPAQLWVVQITQWQKLAPLDPADLMPISCILSSSSPISTVLLKQVLASVALPMPGGPTNRPAAAGLRWPHRAGIQGGAMASQHTHPLSTTSLHSREALRPEVQCSSISMCLFSARPMAKAKAGGLDKVGSQASQRRRSSPARPKRRQFGAVSNSDVQHTSASPDRQFHQFETCAHSSSTSAFQITTFKHNQIAELWCTQLGARSIGKML